MERKMKGKRGITLIALVVTIVVLLILAGITINMLFSNGGIFKTAQDAANAWNEATINEQESLNNLAEQIENLVNGQTGGGEETPEEPVDITTVTEIVEREEGQRAKDIYGNIVVVPKGFKVVVSEGTTVPEGIVIEDGTGTETTTGNQFVWIPVGTVYEDSTGTNTSTIKLGRYTFDTSNGTPTMQQAAFAGDNESNPSQTYANEVPIDDDHIELDESMCYINGKTPLKGAKVEATDLRCGAALLIAGLIADGITEISNVYHIDRGYANIDQKLITLGAVIRRIKVDEFNRVEGMNNVFAIGDQCIQTSDKDYPNGHPQLAQVAIQQGKLLAENLKRIEKSKSLKPFHYRNLGSMATVGRNRAVAEFSKIKMQGWFAWVMWLVVHLRSILGVRNKVVVLLNWIWNYLTYDQSLRMIVYAKKAKEVREREALEAKTHLGNDILHPDNK